MKGLVSSRRKCSLGELAERFGCVLRGDPDVMIDSVGPLSGGPSAVGIAFGEGLTEALMKTRLAAVVLQEHAAKLCPVAALIHSSPHPTFARIAAWLHPLAALEPGIHPAAVVHADASVDASAQVEALAFVGAGAVIGARCYVGPHAIVGGDVVVGADTRLLERATVMSGSRIGSRCIVHPGAVIGSDGFGNARENKRWVKVPQLGRVIVGDDVEIGANTTIDCGALDDTVIEDGVRLDNQIQIAHNVTIGAHTAIAACTGIAGSVNIGKHCMIGGGAGISGPATIADDVIIGGFGQVGKSINKPGMYANVILAEEARTWRRIVGRIKRLDKLVARVRRLEVASGVAAPEQKDEE